MYLTASELDRRPGVRHGFFTRRGGVSTGIFAELNCGGRGTAESAAVVDENRARAAAELRIAPDALVSVHQVHGPDVVTVDRAWPADARPKADAMVTRIPGLGLGILTADCVPVLFADGEAGVIGAAHAGWKGAYAGVLSATLEAMKSLGAHPSRIVVAIGPSIARASYEVNAAFRERFIETVPGHHVFFSDFASDGHCRFDLPRYVRHRLSEAGVQNIEVLGNDTYDDEERFYSYRRSVHRGEPDYGRQISIITLSPEVERREGL